MTVPLWVAEYLWTQERCTIIPPNWLDEEILKDYLDQELWLWNHENAGAVDNLKLIKLPDYNFFELCIKLLKDNTEEMPNAKQMWAIVMDIF